ncbi:MAG: archaeosortase/exosortase family protein [Pseudomonadota bacterium]
MNPSMATVNSSALRHWRHPGWLVLMQLGALWPHWVWMARRTVDGSDEPRGVLALLTIIALVLAERRQLSSVAAAPVLLTAGLLSFVATLGMHYLSPIIAAAVAVLAVTVLLAGSLPQPDHAGSRAALAVLALLALPLTASLNFYLGYPLRWVCAQGASAMISLAGWQVTPEGAALIWNGKTILVDAPCAGIAMLWIGIYAAALMSYLYRASWLRTGLNLIAAAVLVLAGNTLRNALLFFKEAGIAALPDWTHEGIGLLVFGLLFWLLFHITSWRSHAPR